MRKYLLMTCFTTIFCTNLAFSQTKIADNIMLFDDMEGSGNVIYITTKDGNVLIDTGHEKNIKSLASRVSNIKYILTSHKHGDHIGGNVYFGKLGKVEIVAQKNTTDALSVGDGAIAKEGRPTVSFDKDYKFSFAGVNLDLTYLPNAHTNGDFIVKFTDKNMLHVADVSFGDRYNFIDVKSGGTIDGMIKANETVLSMLNDDTLVIPGHGKPYKKPQLISNIAMFKDIRDKVKALKDAGKSLDDVVKSNPTAKYDAVSSWGFVSGNRFVEFVYNSL